MNSSFKCLLPLAILLTSGCASMVNKTYSPERRGTVRYNTGWFLENSNRSKAIEQMREFCFPGRPVLLSEDSRSEFTGQSFSNATIEKNRVNGTSTQAKENNVYMHFKCKSKQAKSTTANYKNIRKTPR